jgi:hypothetical protein
MTRKAMIPYRVAKDVDTKTPFDVFVRTKTPDVKTGKIPLAWLTEESHTTFQ